MFPPSSFHRRLLAGFLCAASCFSAFLGLASANDPERSLAGAPVEKARAALPPAMDLGLIEELAVDHRNRGIAHANNGRYDLAIEEYNVSLRLDPDQSYTYFKRALAYAHKELYEQAIEDYSEAIRLHPDAAHDPGGHARGGDSTGVEDSHLAVFYLNRAAAYKKMGFYDWAIEDTTAATHLQPDFSPAYYNRGVFYLIKGEFERAIENYDKALDLQPRFAYAYTHRGQARFFLGRFEEAARDFQRRASMEPPDPASKAWLYLALERSGQDGGQALHAHAASIDLARWPEPILALFLGGLSPEQLMERLRRFEGKERAEKECEAAFYIGQFYLMQGKLQEAQRHFNNAAAFGFSTFIEHIGSKAELQRMEP